MPRPRQRAAGRVPSVASAAVLLCALGLLHFATVGVQAYDAISGDSFAGTNCWHDSHTDHSAGYSNMHSSCTRSSTDAKLWAASSPSYLYHTLSSPDLVESGTEKQLPYRVAFRVRMSYCDKAASWDAAPSFTNDHNGIVTLGGTLDSKAVKVHMKMENGASSAIPVEENLMWDGWGTGQGTEWWHFDVAQDPRNARVGTKFTAGGDTVGAIGYYDSESGAGAQKSSDCGGKTITGIRIVTHGNTCGKGTYNSGGACVACAAGRFNQYRYQYNKDGNGPNTVCKACSCDTCEDCTASSGACPLKSGYCKLNDQGGGSGLTCYANGGKQTGYPCKKCDSSNSAVWSAVANSPSTSCDDEDLCTNNDKCVNGVCQGTDFGAQCDARCEVCDGSGCSQKSGWTGCVKSGECGCSISGTCYAALAVNPSNTCKHCDPDSNPTGWTNVPTAKACDDGNACTHTDVCGSGVCGGTAYTCNHDASWECRSSYPCDGNGGCVGTNYRPNTYICEAEKNACTLAVYCTGSQATCAAQVAQLPDIVFSYVRETHSGSTTDQAYQTYKDKVYMAASASVSCGALEWKFGLLKDSASCNINGDSSIGGAIDSSWSSSNTATRTGLNLVDGQKYKVVAYAKTVNGNTNFECSNTIMVDTSAPGAGSVIDRLPGSGVGTTDISYSAKDTLLGQWSGFTEPHSVPNWGGLHYDYAIKVSTNGGAQSFALNWRAVSPATDLSEETTTSILTTVTGKDYFFGVRANNEAGLSVEAWSNGVRVDKTPPPTSGIVVRDGLVTSADDDATKSEDTLSCNFDAFSDAESGITHYQYAIGTAASTTSVLGFTDVAGAARTVTHTFASTTTLVDGVNYIFTIRAWNNAVLYSDVSSSGVIRDISEPVFVHAWDVHWDGTANTVDMTYIHAPSKLRVAYKFTDAHSGIDLVQVGITKEPSAANRASQDPDVTGWVDISFSAVGTAEGTHLFSGLPLATNTKYWGCLRATTHSGVRSASWFCTDGVNVDNVPPEAFVVRDTDTPRTGDGNDVLYSSQNKLVTTWEAAIDTGSPLDRYETRVTTAEVTMSHVLNDVTGPGPDQVQDWTSVALATQATFSPTVGGKTYFVTVRCYNDVGLYTDITSSGVAVDFTNPIAGWVIDGTGAEDIDWYATTDTVQAQWDGFVDAESGIAKYEWAVGVCGESEETVMTFTSTNLEKTGYATGLTMVPLTLYCVTVRATNHVGMTIKAVADGHYVDSTAPNTGEVVDIQPRYTGQVIDDTDVQVDTLKLSTRWYNFNDAHTTLDLDYRLCVGDSPSDCNVKAWADIGIVTEIETTVASSMAGKTVYVRIMATNPAGLSTKQSSDGVYIDTTKPDMGNILLGSDLSSLSDTYLSSTSQLHVAWNSFKDAESHIRFYSWCAGTTSGGCDVVADTQVGAQTYASATGLSMSNGATIYVTVTATNWVGLSDSATSAGKLLDSTSPTCGSIVITAGGASGAHAPYWTDDSSLTAHWSGFSDAQTAMSLAVSLGTKAKGAQIVPLHDVTASTTTFTFTGLELHDSVDYYVSVFATNALGASCAASSLATRVDTSPPLGLVVLDGTDVSGGTDASTQTATNTLSAFWYGAWDYESAVTGYEVAFGTTPGGEQVLAFKDVGLSTSYTHSGAIDDHKVYYATVRATNGAGLASTASSDGIDVDSTPPETGAVLDGPVAEVDLDFQSYATWFNISWSNFFDAETEMVKFEVALGSGTASDAARTDVAAWTDVSVHTTQYGWSGLSLTQGATYYGSVRATNVHGSTEVQSSDGSLVDTSSPVGGTVEQTGSDLTMTGSPAVYHSRANTLYAAWSGFADAESGIVEYLVCAGQQPLGCALGSWVSVGTTTSATLAGLPLSHGVETYVTVKAVNAAGGETRVASAATVYDRSPPRAFEVQDGADQLDLRVSWGVTKIVATWTEPVEDTSGIVRYEVAIGTDAAGGGTTVADWTSVGVAQSFTSNTLSLSAGWHYVTVRAFNGAGLYTDAVSNGVLVDTTAPTVGAVTDGATPKKDLWYSPSLTEFAATWSSFKEDESRVTEYRVCLGSDSVSAAADPAARCDVAAQRSVGHESDVTFTGLALTGGAVYKVTVVAYNEVGLSSFATSNGAIVDGTGPVAGTVYETNTAFEWADVSHQLLETEVYAKWQGFSDGETEVVEYFVSAGTTPLHHQLVPFHSVGIATQVKLDGFRTTNGATIYVNVRAVNSAGLHTTVVSNGVTVDTVPPGGFTVKDGGFSVDIDYHIDMNEVTCEWTLSSDAASGVVKYEAGVGSSRTADAADVIGFEDVALALTKTWAPAGGLSSTLLQTQQYFCVIRAYDAVGLHVTAVSDGFVVDTTAPVGGIVTDGEEVGVDLQAQGQATDVWATWTAFQEDVGPLVDYQVAVGTSPGDWDLLDFYSVGITRQVHMPTAWFKPQSSFVFGHNTTLFVTVRAHNLVGLTTAVSSNGVTIDLTPPEVSIIVASIGGPPESSDATADHKSCDCQRPHEVLYAGSGVGDDFAVCGCAPGYARDAFEKCVPCPEGTTKPGIGDDPLECLDCPLDAHVNATDWSDPGTRFCECRPPLILGPDLMGCVCPDGYVRGNTTLESERDLCVPCGHGLVKQVPWGNETSLCVECPSTGELQWASNNTCDCPGGMVWEREANQCLCPAGTLERNYTLQKSVTYNVTVEVCDGDDLYSGCDLVVRSQTDEWEEVVRVCDNECPNWAFKDGLGNDIASCRACPTGATPTSDGTSCTCSTAGTVFNAATATCQCVAGTAWDGNVGACTKCSYGEFAAVPSDVGGIILSLDEPPMDGCRRCPVRPYTNATASSIPVLYAEWESFPEAESVIDHYEVAVGTTEGGSQVLPFKSVGLERWARLEGAAFDFNVEVYITVVAWNSVGMPTISVSEPVVLDKSPPISGSVWDGTVAQFESQRAPGAVDVEYWPDPHTFTVRWSEFTESKSGLRSYVWGLGSRPGVIDRYGPIVDERVTIMEGTTEDAGMLSGHRYYAVVVAINGAGLQTVASSDGFVVDVTPPSAGVVYDGPRPGMDYDCQDASTVIGISASWGGFEDKQSFISHYHWAIGTEPHGTDLQSWVPVGLDRSATNPRIRMQVGCVVYVSVRAYNRAGLMTEVSSDGLKGVCGARCADQSSRNFLCVGLESNDAFSLAIS